MPLSTEFQNFTDAIVSKLEALSLANQNLNTIITDLKAGSTTEYDTLKKIGDAIDFVKTLLTSDDVNLDSFQEIVAYIKSNKTLIDSITSSKADVNHTHAIATTSANGFMSSADKTKLDGIATGANNYSLPVATAGVLGGVKQGANVTIDANGVISASNSYTHPSGDGNLHVPATSTTNNGKFLKAGATAGAVSWNALSATDIPNLDASKITTGTLTVATSGNAGTATKLATARTIALTGDATATATSFDGSANISLATTLANSGVTAGTYGSATQIPTMTVDTKGRVTSISNTSISSPVINGFNHYYYYSSSTGDSFSKIFIGNNAGLNCPSISKHILIGYSSGEFISSTSTSKYCIGIGHETLKYITSGSLNTAIGTVAMANTSSGSKNSSLGCNTLFYNTTGDCNTASGAQALYQYKPNATTPVYITYANARNSATTDSGNTALGAYAGYDNIEYVNTTSIGYNAQVTASNQLQLGDIYTNVYAQNALNVRSDARDKTDIQPLDIRLGLDFIKALTPVEYRMDERSRYVDYKEVKTTVTDENGNEREEISYEKIELTKDGSRKGNRFQQGLIAQEVKEVMDSLGVDFSGYQDHKVKGGDDVLTLSYEKLIPSLILAIQQQQQQIDDLKARLG